MPALGLVSWSLLRNRAPRWVKGRSAAVASGAWWSCCEGGCWSGSQQPGAASAGQHGKEDAGDFKLQ